MHVMRWSPIVVVLALTVAACGTGDEESGARGGSATDAAEASTTPDVSEQPTTAAAPPTDGATTTAAPTTTADPSTADPSTADPTTTVAPTTTVSPTTAAPLTAADLDLAEAAIGPVAFGTGVEPALAVLVPVLGAPATDESAEYPYADEVNGDYLDDLDGVFAFPTLRRVCFANGLCAAFGGRSVADLQLVGYDYFTAEEPTPPVLATTTGVPLGARWSDHLAAMEVQAGGCYSQGFGKSAGVQLVLTSSGEFFGTFDGETYVEAIPDPADVTVYGMRSGENPGYLYEDC